jgi:thiol-disulfide isomerase/thioredoxin
MHPLAGPFNIHGKVWEVASLSPDGMEMVLRPSDALVEMRAYLDPGYPAPAFAGKGLDDKPVALKEATAGAKYVLVDFWASWCGPCRYEYPNFRRLYARYKDHGLRIVGVNLDTQHEPAVKAAGDEMLEYPHVFDGQGWKSAVAVLYRVHAIPQTYLLDKDLKIVAKNLRGPALAKRLEELLGPGDEAAAKAVDAKATQRALSVATEAIRKIEGIEQAEVRLQAQPEGSAGRPTATVRVKPAQAKELDAKAQNAIRGVMIRTFLGIRPQDVTIVDLSKEKGAEPEKK